MPDELVEQPNEQGWIPVQLSANVTAHLKKLNGVEVRKADRLCEDLNFQNQTRALASVRKISANGQETAFGMPVNSSDLDRIVVRLDANEYDMLGLKYVEMFVSSDLEAQAKKLRDRQ
jgi:hypothetical protein